MAGNGVGTRLSALFLLVLLVITIGMMQVQEAEGRMCKTPSGKFKGYCVSSTNCKNVCRTEGFPTGSCDFHVTSRKCYCYKPCP
uniref:Defensin n=1 Tax=Pinus sylvestris TaxID=3349 RepID=A0A896SZ31_PINSY|nr:defensin [Pinus sylvestris]